MANPFAGTTVISSAGVSPAIGLDPTSRATTLMMITGPSAAGSVMIQVTLDSLTPQNPVQAWQNASSMVYSAPADGAFLSILGPIAGCRLNSSGLSAGSYTLKALQSITAGP